MADLSDVEAALVSAIISVLYPSGLAGVCVAGAGARVYRGWPMTAALAADLAGGMINVSVAAIPDTAKNTTRWGNYTWTEAGVAGIGVAVSGNIAMFSGQAGAGDLVGLLAGGKSYVYQCRAGDSASLVASALFALVRQDQVCQLRGGSIAMPYVASVIARTAPLNASLTEIGRQEQKFRVAVWSPTVALRDSTCTFIGAHLAETAFLGLSDGTGGRLRYSDTASIDDGQDAGVYRRDLVYSIDYPTTISQLLPSMLFGDSVCNGVTEFA